MYFTSLTSTHDHGNRGHNSSSDHGEQQNRTEKVVGATRKLSSKNTASVQHTSYTYHYYLTMVSFQKNAESSLPAAVTQGRHSSSQSPNQLEARILLTMMDTYHHPLLIASYDKDLATILYFLCPSPHTVFSHIRVF